LTAIKHFQLRNVPLVWLKRTKFQINYFKIGDCKKLKCERSLSCGTGPGPNSGYSQTLFGACLSNVYFFILQIKWNKERKRTNRGERTTENIKTERKNRKNSWTERKIMEITKKQTKEKEPYVIQCVKKTKARTQRKRKKKKKD
jgi:hypothetical protein